MGMEFIWLASIFFAAGIAGGLAALGYFIGEGLKNFQNPNATDVSEPIDSWNLIKEKHIHQFLGISEEDAASLLKDYPDIPHMKINNNIYFPKAKLRAWMKGDVK